jgi:hypothetical protein
MNILISGDRSTVSNARLQRHFVVQVILHDNPVQPHGAVTITNLHDSVINSLPIEITHSTVMEHV